MNAGWQKLTVKEVAAPIKNALVGGPFGSNLVSADYVPDGIPVIRGENLGTGRWVTGEFVYVSQGKAESLSSNLARPGDLVFTQRGTLGQVAIVPPGRFDKYLISQSQMKLTPDEAKVDALFLFYVFTSPVQQDYIHRHAIQTGVPHTNLGILRSTPISVPSRSEQRAIANVLGTLDDKIELNRWMNGTLEAIARRIFKSWFVDFDPVRAKAEGRSPAGMGAATAALFPSAFEDSSLGKIPKGWNTGVLGDLTENARRGLKPQNIAPGTPYIALDHMPRRSISLSEWGAAEEATSNKFEFLRGEILFGKLRPYFHKVGVAPVDGVCSTDILVIRPRKDCWYGIVLGHLSSDEFVAHTDGGSTGTKMPRTTWPEMARYEICLPDAGIAAAFNALVIPMIEKIRLNILESQTLAAIREALLPKLISGEIRIGQAEHTIATSA